VSGTAAESALLTALVPVRAYHPVYLGRALGSILAQTSPRWRLLIVDDGADEGLAAVAAAALADDRARLIRGEGRGLASALNTGMRHATTDFVAILLGDDLWAPEAVEVLTSTIERHPEADFLHSGRVFVDGDDRPLSSPYLPAESFTLAEFARGSPVKHLLCWRRERGLAVGGLDEAIRHMGPDDYDFPWTMAEQGARFVAVPEPLYRLRDHRDSFRLTTHVPRSVHVRELRRVLRKHGVGRLETERRILGARRGYLRQCLYRNRLDRWLKERLGHDARRGWREPYA
jgi:glycosyltransferase involved in cell wall biosynthesis